MTSEGNDQGAPRSNAWAHWTLQQISPGLHSA